MMPPSYIRECEDALRLYLAPWQRVEHGDAGRQRQGRRVHEMEDRLEGPE